MEVVLCHSSLYDLQAWRLGQGAERGSQIMTDKYGVYTKLKKLGYTQDAVDHHKKEWARRNVHTNGLEGFWSQLKRSIRGTHVSVSPKYLQAYADERAFLYCRSDGFEKILARL